MPFDVDGALKDGAQPSQIAEFLAGKSNFDIAAARKDGASDTDIAHFLAGRVGGAGAPPDADNAHTLATMGSPEGLIGPAAEGGPAVGTAAPSDNSSTPIIGPIRRGVASMVNGVGHTVGLFAPQTGKSISDSANQADLMAPSSVGAVRDDYKKGDYVGAALNVPSAALEAVPQVLGAIGTGIAGTAAGTAVGGPVGGVAGGLTALGAYGAATQGGDLARARAAYNNRAEPSASDAAIGVLGAAGLNMLPGAAGPLGGLERTAASTISQVGKHALADGVQAVGQQAVATAGTDQGGPLGSYDPASIATQATLGAATRAGLGAGRGITDRLDGTTDAANTAALRAKYAALTPDQQQALQNQVLAARTLQARQDSTVDPLEGDDGPNGSRAARAGLRGAAGMVAQTGDFVQHLSDTGNIDPAAVPKVEALISQAANSQLPVHPSDMAILGDAGLAPEAQAYLRSQISQMNMLSDAGINNRGSGMFSTAGRMLGRVAGFSGGELVGHPIMGLEVGGKIGDALGSRVGGLLGVNEPRLVQSAAGAKAMLDAAGVNVPDNDAARAQAMGQTQDAYATQARMMGLGGDQPQGAPQSPPQPPQAPPAPTTQPAPPGPPEPSAAPPGANVGADPLAAAQARAQAQTGLKPMAPVTDPVQVAQARAATAQQDPTTGSTPLLSAVMPVPPSTTADWLAQGQSIPRAQYAAGEDLSNRIQRAGTPKPINPAEEFKTAVQQLQAKGAFDKQFADALLQHRGPLVYGIHKMIVNQMLMNHGIDMRTSDAQAAMPGMQAPAQPMMNAAQ